MNEQKAKLIIEKLTAMEQFCGETRTFIEELLQTPAETVTPAVVKPVVVAAPVVAPVAEPAPVVAPVEEDAAEEMTVESVIAQFGLMDMEIPEMKEYLDSYEIKYNKQKKAKQYFAETIAQAIIDGIIATEEEVENAPVTEETPVVGETVEILEAVVADAVDATEEVTGNEIRASKEAKIESTIRDDFKSKKLKPTAVKNFLKQYYDGDPDCADCKGCSQEELLDCYIEIQKSLVDDEGDLMELSNPYVRNDENYCCGKPLVEHPDDANVLVCEICGENYEA